MKSSIDKTEHRYQKYSLWIILGLTLLGLLITQITVRSFFIYPIITSSLFCLITSLCYGKAWQYIALKSPSSLTKFYLSASFVRMFLALAVIIIGVFVLRHDRSSMIEFVGVFSGFYLFIMVFDNIYFFTVEKNNKINNRKI